MTTLEIGSRIDPQPDTRTGLFDLLYCIAAGSNTPLSGPAAADAQQRLGGAYTRGLSASNGAAGGFLVPGQTADRVMAATLAQSIVRPRATVVEMAGLEVIVPVLSPTVGTTNGLSEAYTGGFHPTFVGDTYQPPPDGPEFRAISV